jgi:signal transduction histidine kinase
MLVSPYYLRACAEPQVPFRLGARKEAQVPEAWQESFIAEMKRYLGFSNEDTQLLVALGPRMEKYFPQLAEVFYSRIPHHPQAFRVFSGGAAQIARLKQTLQQWARGLFSGVYDDAYAEARYQIGYRHVRIGLEQKYVISAMGIVRAYLSECLLLEFAASDERLRYARSLNRILDLDLNLMCESYMHASMENLRMLNEQLERANRELAEASRSKDEFLAHTSHELRTPLNSILGFTKLILDGLATSRDEERELLRDVFASAQHLLGLVNDILDIGRIEAGKMSLHIEDVDPREVLDSTLPLVTVPAAEKGLALRDETKDAPLPRVRADEVRFRQVLLNLLSNAVKFTPKGSVTLRANLASQPGFLRLEVEDTGIGIPQEKRDAVFEKFVQAHPAQSRRHGGSGLGLAISRKLVEMMDGTIGIESGANGSGTLVWFTMPLAQNVAAAPRGPGRAKARTPAQS